MKTQRPKIMQLGGFLHPLLLIKSNKDLYESDK